MNVMKIAQIEHIIIIIYVKIVILIVKLAIEVLTIIVQIAELVQIQINFYILEIVLPHV